MLVVIDTDHIGSYKPNYHTIGQEVNEHHSPWTLKDNLRNSLFRVVLC